MSTYSPIASLTLSASTSSVTFSNIPQTYTDLVLVMNITSTSTAANYIYLQYNGDTGSNYSTTILSGNGTSAASTRFSNRTNFNIDYNATPNTEISNRIVQIMNYSNTTTYKTGLVRANRAGGGTDAIVGLWRSTAAITSIVVTHDTANFASGSTFNLYGISTANINTGKAIGGDNVYSDGSYWYHVFNTSGTFTPTASLTADYLVVAGGGGGGRSGGGGGGAGGLRSTVTATGGGGSLESSLSLTAQAYTVTVGAGGASETNGSNSVFSTITSTGGGRGATYITASQVGGSGGGGSGHNASPGNTGAAGTANQGRAGGNAANGGAGGGGGASVAGANATTNTSTAGGAGVAVAISGSSVTYAGGGGGGGWYNPTTNGAAGGSGGGGAGGNGGGSTGFVGIAATANTGGGGGGGGGGSVTDPAGGAGGSGIVIIRYSV